MSNVTATPRGNADGTNTTQFSSSVGSTAVQYTYPVTQEILEIWNKGNVNLILNVGTYTNQTITPNSRWRNSIPFTQFDIKSASLVGEFQATAYEIVSLGGIATKGATTSRPTNAYIGQMFFDTTLNKPIWYKTTSTWIDATGTTV